MLQSVVAIEPAGGPLCLERQWFAKFEVREVTALPCSTGKEESIKRWVLKTNLESRVLRPVYVNVPRSGSLDSKGAGLLIAQTLTHQIGKMTGGSRRDGLKDVIIVVVIAFHVVAAAVVIATTHILQFVLAAATATTTPVARCMRRLT